MQGASVAALPPQDQLRHNKKKTLSRTLSSAAELPRIPFRGEFMLQGALSSHGLIRNHEGCPIKVKKAVCLRNYSQDSSQIFNRRFSSSDSHSTEHYSIKLSSQPRLANREREKQYSYAWSNPFVMASLVHSS